MSVNKAIEALAESWASLDGALPEYRYERETNQYIGGYHEGYTADAEELAKRLRERGFEIISIRCASGPQPAADSPDSEPSLAVGATHSSEVA